MERLSRKLTLPESRRAASLLGLVGHYLAACQRHEADISDREGGREAAWTIQCALATRSV